MTGRRLNNRAFGQFLPKLTSPGRPGPETSERTRPFRMGIKCYRCRKFINPDDEGVEAVMDGDSETGETYGEIGAICPDCTGYQPPLSDEEVAARWTSDDEPLRETLQPIPEKSGTSGDAGETDNRDLSEWEDVDLPY